MSFWHRKTRGQGLFCTRKGNTERRNRSALSGGTDAEGWHTGTAGRACDREKWNDAGEDFCEVRLTIHEGKFHQVKRMFEAEGCEVIYLKRLSM